jgi:hypothetical protein
MSVAEQRQSEPTAGGPVGKVIGEAKKAAGSAGGSELASGPKSWPDDLIPPQRGVRLRPADWGHGTPELAAIAGGALDINEHEPVYRAARDVVQALIQTRWSLHAATVVVALRRLCDTLQSADAWTTGTRAVCGGRDAADAAGDSR